MKVIACDNQTNPVKLEVCIEGIGCLETSIKPMDSIKEILPLCDYISLHIPKQSGGQSVIKSEEFELMKDGVRIVNAARGGVINEDDLITALDNGKVAACALLSAGRHGAG